MKKRPNRDGTVSSPLDSFTCHFSKVVIPGKHYVCPVISPNLLVDCHGNHDHFSDPPRGVPTATFYPHHHDLACFVPHLLPPVLFKMPKAAPIKWGRWEEGGSYPETNDPGGSEQRSVAVQVDQYLLFDIAMDDDISSAKLGLTGEEAETIREMRPDIRRIAQGEEAKKYRACSCWTSIISIASRNHRHVLYPPHVGPRCG